MMEEHHSAWRYPESSAPTLCVRRGQAAASPASADAEPRLVVDGPSTYDAGRSERFTTADASGQAVDGAASQRAAAASTSVPSICRARRPYSLKVPGPVLTAYGWGA
ncbi:hypothetical protein Q4I28_002970 [Leishmania naiffi]|uniref:Uncharacterized protein n=1 Tax=Leishmania naiffi TaxID=5678 RepID=A0AAW3BUA6_9TRYP